MQVRPCHNHLWGKHFPLMISLFVSAFNSLVPNVVSLYLSFCNLVTIFLGCSHGPVSWCFSFCGASYFASRSPWCFSWIGYLNFWLFSSGDIFHPNFRLGRSAYFDLSVRGRGFNLGSSWEWDLQQGYPWRRSFTNNIITSTLGMHDSTAICYLSGSHTD